MQTSALSPKNLPQARLSETPQKGVAQVEVGPLPKPQAKLVDAFKARAETTTVSNLPFIEAQVARPGEPLVSNRGIDPISTTTPDFSKMSPEEATSARIAFESELRYLELQRARMDTWRKSADMTSRTVRFYNGVDHVSIDAACKQLDWLTSLSKDPITIELHSPGGSVIDGLYLYDKIQALKDKGIEVTVSAYGMAASMGGILLQAGNKRQMSRNCELLIHEIRGGMQGTSSTIRDQVQFWDRLEHKLLTILSERSNMSIDEVRAKWDHRDWWMDAKTALEHGFIDEII